MINFACIFKVFTKLLESRSDAGNLENYENTSENNPKLHEGFYSVKVQFNKSLLSTEIALKMYLVTSLALDKC